MGVSDITVTALTATPTLRGTKLVAAVNDPRQGAIPNLAADAVEFYAATSNSFPAATKVVEGAGLASGQSEALHAGLVEEATYFYWAVVRNKIGSQGAKYPASDTGGIPATAIGQSGLAFGLSNGKLVASVASNALTVAVKTAAGNDATPYDPVYVAFRDATLSGGGYTVRAIAAALSMTIPAGVIFCLPNEPFRLWWVIFDDGGTLRLAVIRCRAEPAVYPLPEHGVGSAAVIAAGVNSGLLYASQAITNKPFRIIGYTEWAPGSFTSAVGNYTVAPDIVQLFGPGIKKPGDQVAVYASRSTNTPSGAAAANVIPFDNTRPQSTEGASELSLTITPTSPANVMQIDTVHNLARSTAGILIVALFVNGDANAKAVGTGYAGADVPISVRAMRVHAMLAASNTYTARYGVDSAAVTLYLNGNSAGATFGVSWQSSLSVTEFMG